MATTAKARKTTAFVGLMYVRVSDERNKRATEEERDARHHGAWESQVGVEGPGSELIDATHFILCFRYHLGLP